MISKGKLSIKRETAHSHKTNAASHQSASGWHTYTGLPTSCKHASQAVWHRQNNHSNGMIIDGEGHGSGFHLSKQTRSRSKVKGKNMLRELNDIEMEETSGGIANVIFGAAVGAGAYWVANAGRGYSLGGLAASVGIGAATSGLGVIAVGGRLTATTGAQAIRSGVNGFNTGIAGGIAGRASTGGFSGGTGGSASGGTGYVATRINRVK